MSILRRARDAEDTGLLRLSRSTIIIVTICVAIVVLVGTATSLAIWNTRQHAFQEHERDVTNLAFALAEQTTRYVETVDLTIMEVKSWATELDRRSRATFKNRMQSADIHQSLVERRANVLAAPAIVLIGADGEVLNSSQPAFAPDLNVTDRDYYQYLKYHDDPAVVIG
jgi:hypothetical protein